MPVIALPFLHEKPLSWGSHSRLCASGAFGAWHSTPAAWAVPGSSWHGSWSPAGEVPAWEEPEANPRARWGHCDGSTGTSLSPHGNKDLAEHTRNSSPTLPTAPQTQEYCQVLELGGLVVVCGEIFWVFQPVQCFNKKLRSLKKWVMICFLLDSLASMNPILCIQPHCTLCCESL